MREYWRNLLGAVAAPTTLTGDRPSGSPLGDGESRPRLDWTLPPSINETLEETAQRASVPVETVIAAAFCFVVGRHARDAAVVYGEVVDCSGEPLLLPALVQLQTDTTVSVWLRKLHTERDARVAHRHISLRDIQGLTGIPDGKPLVELVLSLVHKECPPPLLTQDPFVFWYDNSSKQLCAQWSASRVSTQDIQRFLRHWGTAIHELAARLDERIDAISLLDATDRKVLAHVNATSTPYPTVCLHQLIEEQVERTPDTIAILFQDQRVTYAELNRLANRLAHRLQLEGVGPDVLVGIYLERSLDLFVALLSVLKAGGAYVPLDPAYPTDRIQSMIEDASLRVVLTDRNTDSSLPSNTAKRIVVDSQALKVATESTLNPECAVTPRHLAYVIFTSGSTGRPKGAMTEHRNVTNCLLWMQSAYPLGQSDRFLHKTPISFDASVCELFWPLIAGAAIEVAVPGGHKDPRYLIDIIRRRQVTVVDFVPSMLTAFLEESAASDCVSLRHVTCGGEALTVQLVERFYAKLPHAQLHNLYGPTEAAVNVTYWDCPTKPSLLSFVPIGRPVANTTIHILDANLNPLPPGVAGELCIGGVMVGRGYLGRPELTAERFLRDPFEDSDGARLYRTGDLARILPEGTIEFLGRIDTQVKLRGFRIELGEIEAVLVTLPRIREAAVIARDDEGIDRRLVAYLVSVDAERIPRTELIEWLGARLPEFMIPTVFVWMSALPLAPSGKLDRRALPVPARERPDTGSPPTPPRSKEESELCDIFASVLGFSPVGAEDNFFDVGGNSLLSMKVLGLLRERLGLDLPVARFFQHPSPRSLAQHLGLGGISTRKAIRFTQHSMAARSDHEPIAIIGMAGRFPGAKSVDALWRLVCAGQDGITHFSESELDRSLPEELVRAPNYIRARGVIEGFDYFDAGFFGISPRDAELMDPQQRLLLETAWEALENAGYCPESAPGLVGVFAGMYGNSYLTYHLLSRPEHQGPLDDLSILLQNEKDYVATRIAHRLNLQGPALSIHTACSTSLVTVAEAFFSLRSGRCDLALAGGASLTCPPKSGYLYVEGSMLSSDGRTRTFDAAATGTTFNDGVAVVVLKRLSDALHDRDCIYGVIHGAAVNNDGGEKASFTAPSVDGQSAVVRMALDCSGFHPRTIGYVETHGTATPLGDPIEIDALTQAFRSQTTDKGFCAVSSVKSNIGHLVTAAGATGLIKAALALRNQMIPGTAHFKNLNPHTDWADSPFYVTDQLQQWPRGDHPRRAGVSSFGVGGTNAHVVLEEAPAVESSASPRRAQLLLLSARTSAALEKAGENLAEHLANAQKDANLADISFTLARGRRAFRERAFVVASSPSEAAATLRDWSRRVVRRTALREPSVAFLFPGQGAQSPRMGHVLYQADPVFRTVVDRCADQLKGDLGCDLRDMLYPSDSRLAESDAALRNTRFTQPALFTVEYALSQVLIGLGIHPAAMVGHSIGEFVCAVVSGVMSLQDALDLVAARAALMQSMPTGSMLSVRLSAAQVADKLPNDVAIASDNGPTSCVVSGPTESISRLADNLTAQGVVCRQLLTSHAFHSPMMDPIVAPFSARVRGITLSPPKIPFVSTLTGDWIRTEEACNPDYWGQHLRQTVRFAEAARTLLVDDRRVLVEAGPRATLVTLARQQSIRPASLVALPTLGDCTDAEQECLLRALGNLWTAGIALDFDCYFGDEQRRRVPLPTYPFERKRYWVESLRGLAAPNRDAATPSADPTISVSLEATIPYNETVPSAPAQSATTGVDAGAFEAPGGTQEETMDATTAHVERLTAKLRNVFEEISGFEIEPDTYNTSFLELGLDSLSLTQVAQHIVKAFGIKISFRELMESYPTLQTLSEHMARQLPPEPQPASPPRNPALAAAMPQQAPPQSTATPVLMASAVATPIAGDAVQRIVDQQLSLMRQQLELLSGARGINAVPMPEIRQSGTPALQVTVAPQAVAAPAPAAAAQVRSPGGAAQEEEEQGVTRYDPKKAFGAIARITTQQSAELSPKQVVWLNAFMRRYTERTRKSKEYTQSKRHVLADPRAVTGFRPPVKELVYQIVIDRSRGCRMWDLDGNEYIDVLSGFGCNLFGWQPDFVSAAVIKQIERGHEIGPMTPLAAEVAELVCELTGLERAGFCNTGSEAVMGCMRIARTVTGRSTIVMFSGSYHGIFDEVIVRGTKKLRSVPAAPGIMPSTSQNVLVLDYGAPESLEIIRERANELAAILVEPVQSRAPDNQPREFVHELRRIATQSGALLIFDEVITGFRSHPGGAQAVYGVRADLASYGKVIGGGYPFGVIAGKAEYMDALDGGFWQYGDDSVPTVGVTYFAGTFCRHPLALAAAKASLLHLKEQGPRLQETLNAKTERLASHLNEYFMRVGAPLKVKHFASLWKVFWTQEQTWADLLFYVLRDRGIHILDQFPCFLTTAHTDEDVAAIELAFQQSISELQSAGFLPGKPDQPDSVLNPNAPPVPGARLGRDPAGNPAWYVPDPKQPGGYVQVQANQTTQ